MSLIFLTESSASAFRSYYEKYLFPYDVFLSGATIGPEVWHFTNALPHETYS